MAEERQNEKTLESESVLYVPVLQRIHWMATSAAAVLTSLVILLPLATVIETTTFQIVMVVISIGILVAIISNKPVEKYRIEWPEVLNLLANSRDRIESLIFGVLNGLTDFDSPVQRNSRLNTFVRSLLLRRTFARSVYRFALVQKEQDLAADILLDINEYSDWLKKITALIDKNEENQGDS